MIKIYLILPILFLVSCANDMNFSNFNKKNKNYKVCLNDANHNINTKVNINQDRNDMLQTDDTMVDLYNIGNEIDQIKLSNKRDDMIKDCLNKAK
tara:strand:- start:1684 stop:1968 length:285 start_codon:yes stop_codon:yes gene_type:complete